MEIELPDRSTLELTTERFQAPEILFNPQLANLNNDSLQNCIDKSINSLPIDFKNEMWNNIVLSGGNSIFPNLQDRLKSELELLAGASNSPFIDSKPERR